MPFLAPVVAFLGTTAGAITAASAVGAGAAIYSANKQGKAVNSAAQAQQSADQAAISEQQRQFDTTQANLQPWLAAGKAALGQQSALLGLGSGVVNGVNGPGGVGGGPAPAQPVAGGYNIQKLLTDPAYADVAQWVQQGHGDPNATGAQTPEQAVNYWIKNGISMGDPRAINAPTYSADDVAAATTPTAGGLDPNSPQGQQQAAIDQLKNSPLYQSLYRNGVDTIDANASATGGLRGGNIQRSLANFGSDTLASVIQQQLANLGGISGQGNNTGTNLGQLGAGVATNIGNLTVNGGAARAGGILGSAAAGNAGLNSALQQLTTGAGQAYAQYRSGGSPSAAYAGPQYSGVQPFDPINGLF